MRRSERGALVGAIALAGVVVVWWATCFGPDQPRIPLDTVLYFLPSYASIAAHFRAGTIPLWNPYQLCGIPWIGTLQSGVFYPPHALYVILPLQQALAANGVLHLLLITFATAAFVRRLGLGVVAAGLAAVVFGLRGTVFNAVAEVSYFEAIAWLPVGAIALVDLVRAPGRGAIALLAAATGLSLLAGYPQASVYVVYTWGSLFLALLAQERPSLAGIAKRAGGFVAAVGIGGIIAAVQLLPAFELMRSGLRSAAGLTDQTMFALAPEWTPALSVIGRETIAGAPRAAGVLALALGAAAIMAPGRTAIGVWAVGVATLSAAWALGRFTPLFDLYLALPLMRLFREPSRMLVVTDFALAIAAALGLTALIGPTNGEPTARERRRRWGAVGLVMLALAMLFLLVRHGFAPNARYAAVTCVAAAVAVAAIAMTRAAWRPAVGAAIGLAAMALVLANPAPGYRMPYHAEDVERYAGFANDLDRLAQQAGHDRVWLTLVGGQSENALKLATWHRLRTTADYEPVNLWRQASFFTYFADRSSTPVRLPWLFAGNANSLEAPSAGTGPGTRRRLLDLASVRYVTFPLGALLMQPVRTFVDQARLERDTATEHLVVFRNPHVLPRAFVTYRTRTAPADPDELLAHLSDEAFDPLAESFVEGPPPFPADDAAPRGHAAVFVRDDETVVEIDVTLDRPGLVVLADSFYPGWRATVDGEPGVILATNHLFRGIPAPAGPHRIRFSYEPWSVRLGALSSVLGLVVAAALGFTRPKTP